MYIIKLHVCMHLHVHVMYMYIYRCMCYLYISVIHTVHAAVMAINEVLEKEDAQETLKALQNPSACLVDVQAGNAERYQPHLLQAKRDKAERAGSQVKWERGTMATEGSTVC